MKPSRRAVFAFLFVGAILAVWLRLPLLTAPFFLDDLVQMGFLAEGNSQSYSFNNDLDLYRFFDRDTEAGEKMSAGDLPWRFDDTQRCAFLRPVSSALMWLDHALFGLRSKPAHAHSLAWFVLFVFLLYRLYGRILPSGAAEIGTLAAILSPAGIMTIMWWSAREALLAAFFAASALLFHHRWCKDGRPRLLLLSLVSLALGLLSAESGVQALAFVFAYSAVRSRGDLKECITALLPSAVVFLVYLITWSSLGYGVEGNALYVNPLGEPIAYAANVASKFHLAVASAVLGQGSSWWMRSAVLLVAAALAWRLPRRSASATALTWLLLASVLALIPSFGGRNALRPWTLVIPQIGFHAVLGLLIASPWSCGGGSSRATLLSRAGAVFLFVVCLILPAREFSTSAPLRRRATDSPEALARQFPAEVRDAITPELRYLILLRAPVAVMPVGRLGLWHGVDGFDDDALSTIVLSDTGTIPLEKSGLAVTRTGPRTLLVEAAVPLVRANDFFRFDSRKPLRVGQTVSLADVSVTVKELDDLRPTALEFVSSRSLDSQELLLLTWTNGRYEVVVPPSVGQAVPLR